MVARCSRPHFCSLSSVVERQCRQGIWGCVVASSCVADLANCSRPYGNFLVTAISNTTDAHAYLSWNAARRITDVFRSPSVASLRKRIVQPRMTRQPESSPDRSNFQPAINGSTVLSRQPASCTVPSATADVEKANLQLDQY